MSEVPRFYRISRKVVRVFPNRVLMIDGEQAPYDGRDNRPPAKVIPFRPPRSTPPRRPIE
jgi:hypothetical protein